MKSFKRAQHAAGHVGKDIVRFQFDITIQKVSDLPSEAKVVCVMWQRGAKSVQTQAIAASQNVAVFNEKKQMLATLYRDRSSKEFDEKDYKFSLMETTKRKKIGKVHINLAAYALPNYREELVLPMESRFKTAPALKITIEALFVSNMQSAPSDAISELSFATSATNLSNLSGNKSDDLDNDIDDLAERDADLLDESPGFATQQTPPSPQTTPTQALSSPAPPAPLPNIATPNTSSERNTLIRPPVSVLRTQSAAPASTTTSSLLRSLQAPGGTSPRIVVDSAQDQIDELKAERDKSARQVVELMQQVQRLKDDVFLLRKQCESKDADISSLNATIEELQIQLEERELALSQRIISDTPVVVVPPEPVLPKSAPRVFQPMNISEVLEAWGGKDAVVALMKKVEGKLLVGLIESHCAAHERLAREIYILETQLARCVKPEPPVAGVTKPTEAMLLARIASLETQLSQARADTGELKRVVAILTSQFVSLVEGKGDTITNLTETVQILGNHIGDVINEKEELTQSLMEEREEQERMRHQQAKDETYAQQRLRRLETEIATKTQQMQLMREREQAWEERETKLRDTIRLMGQKLTTLEVKALGQQ